MMHYLCKIVNFATEFEFTNIQIDEYKNIALCGIQSKRHLIG